MPVKPVTLPMRDSEENQAGRMDKERPAEAILGKLRGLCFQTAYVCKSNECGFVQQGRCHAGEQHADTAQSTQSRGSIIPELKMG